MGKILRSVLDKISENNNEYRTELLDLNARIEEITTNIVGDVVTVSNYNIDFSNMISTTKEKLVSPICKTIESYVIKDLRNVETVNEQFVDKINDKINNAVINSNEDKDNFINSLNDLLNEKYLSIVQIKRTNFFNEYGINSDIEIIINEFMQDVTSIKTIDEDKLINILTEYKKAIYTSIKSTLAKISKLYLNNFISEISDSINNVIDFNNKFDAPLEESINLSIPSMDELEMPAIPELEDMPDFSSMPSFDEIESFVPEEEAPIEFDIPEPVVVEPTYENDDSEEISISMIAEELREEKELKEQEEKDKKVDDLLSSFKTLDNDIEEDVFEENNLFDTIEKNDEPVIEDTLTEPSTAKKTYDVEEILKRAKSPVVTMEYVKPVENVDKYVSVKPIENNDTLSLVNNDFNEKEIVQEMINRLQRRLAEINAKEEALEVEKNQIEEDELFVNNLIKTTADKKAELDAFEAGLNKKTENLDKKQVELNDRINTVMPFANAVLESEK